MNTTSKINSNTQVLSVLVENHVRSAQPRFRSVFAQNV